MLSDELIYENYTTLIFIAQKVWVTLDQISYCESS